MGLKGSMKYGWPQWPGREPTEPQKRKKSQEQKSSEHTRMEGRHVAAGNTSVFLEAILLCQGTPVYTGKGSGHVLKYKNASILFD